VAYAAAALVRRRFDGWLSLREKHANSTGCRISVDHDGARTRNHSRFNMLVGKLTIIVSEAEFGVAPFHGDAK